METKTCSACKAEKPLAEFYKLKSGRLGVHAWCKGCFKKDQRARFERDPERKRRAQRAYDEQHRERIKEARLLRNYGLTLAQFHELLDRQHGRCAVCRCPIDLYVGRKKAICVDHAHDGTDRVRGLLCQSCNRGIGLLGDDIDRLQSAINYLRRT